MLLSKLDNLDRATHEARDKINAVVARHDAAAHSALEISIDKIATRAVEMQREFQHMLGK